MKKKENGKLIRLLLNYLCILIALAAAVLLADVLIKAWDLTRFFNSTISENALKLQDYILSANIPYWLAFMLLQILSVFFFVIPAGAVSFLGGMTFGPLVGFLYSYAALVIGGMGVFFLTRLLGRPFVRKMMKKKTLEKYENKFTERSHLIVLIFMVFPIMPADALCYLMGLTKIKWWHMLILNIIGRPWRTLIYVVMGNGLLGGIPLLLYVAFFEAAFFLLFLTIRHGDKWEAAIFRKFEAIRRKKRPEAQEPLAEK